MLRPIEELEKCLARLPGFGRRSAARAALALVRERVRLADPLLLSLKTACDSICCCSRCGAFTVREENPCRLCTDSTREDGVLCVVEEPSDIVALEAAGVFHGRYHALGGKLSPARRQSPDKLRFASLLERVEKEHFKEVFLALSTDMDGDATAGFIAELLRDVPVKVTRLAFGLPADSGIAYSDPLTLKRAVQGRRDV